MRLPNFLRRRKQVANVQKKGTTELVWPLPEGSFLEYAFGMGGRITATMAMEFYRKNSTIATAVDKIAKKVEQIEPVLMDANGKMIVKHPLLDLLRSPNPFETWQEFIGKATRHYLLKSDSYVGCLGNIARPPLELYAIKPQNVYGNAATDGYPSRYTVSTGIGAGSYKRVEERKRIRFLHGAFNELYHIMGFSSRSDDIQGDSPLEAAALEARQQLKGRTHNLALLDNGGRLSLIVAFKDADGMTDDEHKERKNRVYEDLSGSDNSGKIAVISGAEVEIAEVGKSNKDMDYAVLDQVASQAIFLRYEVPLPLVTTDASTYNNIENALFDFYENTILPVTDTMFSGLSKVLFPRFKVDGLTLTYDPESINTLIRQKLKEIKERKEINIETTNELRALLPNRESIDGGDVLYQNATLVPIGEDRFTDDELTAEELAERYMRDAGLEGGEERNE